MVKFIFILSFMKGVHFFQPSIIAQNKNFEIRYENGYNEKFPFFIHILP